MYKTKKINARIIATTGLLLAVEIILQLLGILIPGTVNINLSLIPVTIGAIMFGPLVGGFLGFMNGIVVLCSPNTISLFMSISPGGTVLTCLTKCLLAGVAAGFIMKPFKNKNQIIGSVLASIAVPLLNTLIFSIYCYLFFMPGLGSMGVTSYATIFTIFIGINFLFEIIINVVITPILTKVLFQLNKDKNI